MRHRITQRKLNRTSSHRRAMQRNLAQSLFEHGQVRTTLPKAKDLRPFAERLVTLAKKAQTGSLTARRQIHKLLSDRSLVPADHREAYEGMSNVKRAKVLRGAGGRRYRTGEAKGKLAFTGESIIHRLINTVAPKYEDRDGGYTRIIRLPNRRIGDHSELAIIQLVGDETGPGSVTRPRRTARKTRTDSRYAAAVKASHGGRQKKATSEGAPEESAEPGEAQASGESGEPSESDGGEDTAGS
ncbi:MAG TPA: 50S ribosomal protein L17 [Phycisphaerae bacterium]|nr:50S ribosomal protein L17 [Phycisphaerae bacterium]